MAGCTRKDSAAAPVSIRFLPPTVSPVALPSVQDEKGGVGSGDIEPTPEPGHWDGEGGD